MKREPSDQPMNSSIMQTPTQAEALRAVRSSQCLFRSTLALWASDALAVRHAGLHRLTWDRRPTATAWSKAA